MREPDDSLPDTRTLAAFALLAVLVMVWGVGHRFYETMMPQFAAVFDLSGTRRALTESAYQIIYVIGAVPGALIARRFGYKATILIGLGSIGMGAFTFYPAAATHGFSYFLFAVMLLALGWIFLEVAVNPLVLVWGSPKTAVRRLNLVQAVYPIGSVIGVYAARAMLGAGLVLPTKGFAYSIAHPYIALGLAAMLLAYLVEETRFPGHAHRPQRSTLTHEIRLLSAQPLFVFAIIAQAANILALGVTWMVATTLFGTSFRELSSGEIADVFVLCLVLFAAGRLAATALMWSFSPALVLAVFSGGGILAALLAASLGGAGAAFGCLALCFFLAPAWPTVFGLAVANQGTQMKLATAAICIGGALGAVVYHFLAGFSPQTNLLVSAFCCALMAAYAASMLRAASRSTAEA